MGMLVEAITGRFASDGPSDVNNPRFWEGVGGFGRKTASGESVSPTRALTVGAYYAALRVISEDIAKLPVHVYRSLSPRGKEVLVGDPVGRLLRDSPNGEMTAFTFRETLTQWAAGWGNGYAEIIRSGSGTPVELWPIHPSRVRVMRSDSGRLFYRVYAEYDPTNPANESMQVTYVDIAMEDMFHLRGMGNHVVGYSVAAFAAETLGVALATQTFGAAFFANGTQGGGILTHPGKLGDVARKNLRESWNTTYGTASKAYRIKLLEEGVTFTNTFVPPDEAQFIETRNFQIEDIARWFRTTPHKIGHLLRATFSNVENLAIEHVTDTLMPWAKRWESEVKRSLIGADASDLFLSHNFSGLLRGDANARANFYRTLFQLGALSPDDIREYEDENPIPGDAGKQYYIQSNMTTLERVFNGTALSTSGQPQTADDPAKIESARTQAENLRPVIEAAADRVLRKVAMGITRAKGVLKEPMVREFFDEIGRNAVDWIGPMAAALNHQTASLLGVQLLPVDTGVWIESWKEHGSAVFAAGGVAGLPATMTPSSIAAEIMNQVLVPYGIIL